MAIVRDPIAIGSVGEYIKKQSEALRLAQTNIELHISNVLNNYKGKDAEVIVAKFMEEAKKLNSIIVNLEYYGNYMKSLAEYDTENLNNTKKNLGIMNDQPVNDLQDIYLENISFSGDVVGGDKNG